MFSVILICFLSITNTFGAIQCLNSSQCVDTKIKQQALCYGFKSCSTQQTKIETNSTVECSGGEACSYARVFANESITCDGAKGCNRARYITSADSNVKCSGWYGCGHSEINAPNGDVSCSGPHSCFSTDMDVKGVASISCTGSRSCQQTFIESSNDGLCDGDQSCAVVNFIGANLYCRAKQSCEKPNYIQTDTIYAYGMRALNTAKAKKVNARQIDALGFLSLFKSNFDTVDNSGNQFDITINMFGLEAGSKSSIQCRAGSVCTLNCLGNGCQDTLLICLDGSECIVTPQDCVINGISAIVSESTWIICPDIEFSTSQKDDQLLLNRFALLSKENEDISEQEQKEQEEDEEEYDDEIDDYLVDDYLMADLYDLEECDDVLECKGRLFNASDPDAICTGYLACSHAVFHFDDDIHCYGYKSCINSEQIYSSGERTDNSAFGHGTGKGFIRCMSEESCFGAGIISAHSQVQCFGRKSCSNVGLIVSRTAMVMCDGSHACQNSTIIASTKANCVSTKSCYNSDISAKVIVCNGPESCSFARMTNKINVVHCDGMRSCTDSSILANFVRAYSYFDTTNARIIAKTVNGYGFGSLAFSRIEPTSETKPGEVSLRVFLHGYKSGYGTEIICLFGETCVLDCKYNACDNTYFTCYYGSTCRVTMNEVDIISRDCGYLASNQSALNHEFNNITSVNGTICPNWVYDKYSFIGNDQLDEYIKMRKENRKYDLIYQQIMNEVTVNTHDDENKQYEFELINDIKIDNYMKTGRKGRKSDYFSFNWHQISLVMIITGVLLVSLSLIIYKYLKENNNDNLKKSLKGEYQPLLV